MPESSLLLIGRISKAHGIRGEVSVAMYTDSPSLLRNGVYLQKSSSSPVFHEVKTYRAHHGATLVQFAGIVDRNAAEALRGVEILIPESHLPEPNDDEVYIYRLMGLTVLHMEESGFRTPLGKISNIAEPAGQELWTISAEGEEDILFPAIPEFVLDIDLDEGFVCISPPPGLIELYRS